MLRVKDLVLREVLDAQAAHRDHRAVIDGHEPRDGLEERRLARAIDTDDADLVPRIHAEVDPGKKLLLAVALREILECYDHLLSSCFHLIRLIILSFSRKS